MEHSIKQEFRSFKKQLTVLENNKAITIKIGVSNSKDSLTNFNEISISKTELNSFIGLLLHLQSKMKSVI